MKEEDSRGVLCQCLDALMDKDRMAYLGSFVQGFIHNVNGPLQNMSLLAEMLIKGQEQQDRAFRRSCPDSSPDWDEVSTRQLKRFQQLQQQIAGLADLLRDFMVVHEAQSNAGDVDLNLVLTKLANVFRADLFFKHQVESELRLTRNLPRISIPGRKLIPAIVHIFRNAIVAMRTVPQKRLTIETRLEDGNRVLVVFRDSGSGFPDGQDVERFFSLFYSAWENGGVDRIEAERPLGFGLYAVRRLLDPYGVTVQMRRDGVETEIALDIPVRC